MTKINEEYVKRRGPYNLPDARVHCISVRVNDLELEKIDLARGTLAKGEYLRCAALDKLQPPAPLIPELNKQAWLDISKAINNLNQISHRLNSNVFNDKTIIDEIRAELNALRDLRPQLISEK